MPKPLFNCGQPGHQKSWDSCNQSWRQTLSVAQQQFSNSCAIFNYTISHILWTASLPISVRNREATQQGLYSYFFVVSKGILNKQILHVMYEGGKSHIWQFHAVTITSWCCRSHTSSEAAWIVWAMKKIVFLSRSLIQVKNLLWFFTSVEDLPTQMLPS